MQPVHHVPTVLLTLLVFLAACGPAAPGTSTPSSIVPPPPTLISSPTRETGIAIPPVYVTVVLHVEDVPSYANCQVYPDLRQRLLQFAQAMAPYEAAINLQTDYEFLVGVSRCETPAMQAATDGRNVLDYLAVHYGYEIDAHQEGGWDLGGQDNYADIRYLAGQLTAATSENVGGLIWDDPAQWATLTQGERGLLHPGFTWTPSVLTLAVSSRHHHGDFSADDHASGVWVPRGAREDFWEHAPHGPLVYVGPGEHNNWNSERPQLATPEFVRDVLTRLEAGDLDREAIYTASIAVPQNVVFHAEEHARLQAVLDQLAPLVASGQVVYATYSQVVDVWRTQYGARPNVYHRP